MHNESSLMRKPTINWLTKPVLEIFRAQRKTLLANMAADKLTEHARLGSSPAKIPGKVLFYNHHGGSSEQEEEGKVSLFSPCSGLD